MSESQSYQRIIQLQQHSISIKDLQVLVSEWLNKHDPYQKHSKFKYKFSLSKILPLPSNLLYHLTLYVLYVKFSFIIQKGSITNQSNNKLGHQTNNINKCLNQQKIQINLRLKQIYQQQFYHGQWKNQFNFQFTMIFITKTISLFIGDYFPSLKINQNLQAHIFIILFKVFIGNQISTKYYHVVSKKYLKNLKNQTQINNTNNHTKNNDLVNKINNKNIKINQSLPKKDSFITLFKPSAKYISEIMHSQSYGGTKHKILYQNQISNYNSINKNINVSNQSPFSIQNSSNMNIQTPSNMNIQNPSNINYRRHHYRNKISFVRAETSLPQKSNLQIFNQQLKKNLYVDPLPKLQPKKMDIVQYQNARLNTQELNYSEYSRLNEQRRELNKQYSKPYNLRSTKISSSMQTLLSVKSRKGDIDKENTKSTQYNNENFESRNEFGKPCKLLLSRQLNSKHYCLTSSSNHNDPNDKPLSELISKQLLSKQMIGKQLKSKIVSSKNINFNNQFSNNMKNNYKHHNSNNSKLNNNNKLSFQEWNQLIKKIKFNSKNSHIYEKQNVSLTKSFQSHIQNHSIHLMSYQKHNKQNSHYLNPIKSIDSYKDQNFNKQKGQIYKQYKTQNHQYNSSPHRKSQSLNNQSNDLLQQQQFAKIVSYTTTMDSNIRLKNQGQKSNKKLQSNNPTRSVTNHTPSPSSHSLFIKSSNKQKLSKTSKLKLDKLAFISQCKQRQLKIQSNQNEWETQNQSLMRKVGVC